MTAQDPALTRALADLTTQVNPDNIMAVHKVFRQHADELQKQLASLDQDAKVKDCGLDPISRDATAAFNGKIAELLQVHKAHQEELDIAAEHLRAIALAYGHTEEEIANSMNQSPR